MLQDTDYLEVGIWMDRTDFSVYHIHNMASGEPSYPLINLPDGVDECGYCISLHFWIFVCIGFMCLLECKHLALGSTRAQCNLLYCFLSARLASGSLSPLLRFSF